MYHIISDLHLEYHLEVKTLSDFVNKYPNLDIDIETIDPTTILLLPGDIGNPIIPDTNYWTFLSD